MQLRLTALLLAFACATPRPLRAIDGTVAACGKPAFDKAHPAFCAQARAEAKRP